MEYLLYLIRRMGGIMADMQVERHYLLASDFDQTLSFNDSGLVLAELIGAKGSRIRSMAWRVATWCNRAESWLI
jgi:hypothetical protein